MAYVNPNDCKSFNQPANTAYLPLSSQICSEVFIINKTGQDLKIVDDPNGPASADRVGATNVLLIGDDESVTIRGITNANQVSAATTSGNGTIYYRTQFFSFNPSR